MTEPVIETLAAVWESISTLCADLGEDQWDRPTECPGWSVKDQLSHLVGSEAVFMGRPRPEHELAGRPDHIRNDLGAANEVVVDVRRSWPGAKVLEEFREVTGERLAQLRAMSPDELAADSWTPVGPGTLRDLLAIRAFDAWTHEQDMRRALGRPGAMDGPGAAHAVQRCLLAMPFVVGKKAGAPDGSTVVFEVTGPAPATLALAVEGGRAKPLADVPAEPTVRVVAGTEAFTRLGCGRWDPDRALADGDVRVEGDRELGERVVRQLNFMI